MGAMFSATLDFGPDPIDEAQVTVTPLPGILTTSHAEAWAMRDATADNNAESHDMLNFFSKFSVGDIVAGTSAIVRCQLHGAKARGQFNIRGVWN